MLYKKKTLSINKVFYYLIIEKENNEMNDTISLDIALEYLNTGNIIDEFDIFSNIIENESTQFEVLTEEVVLEKLDFKAMKDAVVKAITRVINFIKDKALVIFNKIKEIFEKLSSRFDQKMKKAEEIAKTHSKEEISKAMEDEAVQNFIQVQQDSVKDMLDKIEDNNSAPIKIEVPKYQIKEKDLAFVRFVGGDFIKIDKVLSDFWAETNNFIVAIAARGKSPDVRLFDKFEHPEELQMRIEIEYVNPSDAVHFVDYLRGYKKRFDELIALNNGDRDLFKNQLSDLENLKSKVESSNDEEYISKNKENISRVLVLINRYILLTNSIENQYKAALALAVKNIEVLDKAGL